MLSRFHLIPERYGRTDGQICYINIAHQHTVLLTRYKNYCGAVSMPKDSIRTRVVTFDTAKHFIISIETLFKRCLFCS